MYADSQRATAITCIKYKITTRARARAFPRPISRRLAIADRGSTCKFHSLPVRFCETPRKSNEPRRRFSTERSRDVHRFDVSSLRGTAFERREGISAINRQRSIVPGVRDSKRKWRRLVALPPLRFPPRGFKRDSFSRATSPALHPTLLANAGIAAAYLDALAAQSRVVVELP